MSRLRVYQNPQTFQDFQNPQDIQTQLQAVGVLFEQWDTALLKDDASDEDVLRTYHDKIEQMKQELGFQSADLIHMHPEHPQKQALREKFLSEHTHSDYEVRYFVRGQGLFYLHIDDNVFAVLCEQGDLISVPAGVTHWFDMGEHPVLSCIRLFTNEEGWVAQYTGRTVAKDYPSLDALTVQWQQAVS